MNISIPLVRAQTAFATVVSNIRRRVENELSDMTKKLANVAPVVWELAGACKNASSLRLVLAADAIKGSSKRSGLHRSYTACSRRQETSVFHHETGSFGRTTFWLHIGRVEPNQTLPSRLLSQPVDLEVFYLQKLLQQRQHQNRLQPVVLYVASEKEKRQAFFENSKKRACCRKK